MTTTEQLKRTVSGDDFDFLIDCGYSKPLRDCVLDDKKEMLECVILHFTHYRIRAELDQLKGGLAMVGVLPAIQSRPNLWKPLLCHTKSLKVIPDYIRQLFEPVFSVMSSNARRAEKTWVATGKSISKKWVRMSVLYFGHNRLASLTEKLQ